MKRIVPAPPGGELSRGMLDVLIRLWCGRTVWRDDKHNPSAEALVRRGLAQIVTGALPLRCIAQFKLTLLGEQRAYWCRRGRLP